MTTQTKAWLYLCAITLWSGAWWCAGYHTADAAWEAKDTRRKLVDAKAAKDISEKYRAKERQLNETIGQIETRAINDAANAEMEYQAVMDRLRNASAHPADGLRVKPALTCRAVPNNSTTSGNGNEEVQTGLSAEVAGSAIGVGAECDQVVLSLQTCQDYAESLQKYKQKPID